MANTNNKQEETNNDNKQKDAHRRNCKCRCKRKKSPKGNNGFWFQNKKLIIAYLFVIAVLYLVIALIFRGDGFLSAGKDLHKSDWMSFLGSYISFAGTVGISLVAILQSQYYSRKEERERLTKIQPIFSLEITSVNDMVYGTAELIGEKHSQKHKNFTLKVTNAGTLPITNLIMFNENYIKTLLMNGESFSFQCAYEDSPDLKLHHDKLTVISECDAERDESGLPKYVLICYNDADGNDMTQSFVLRNFAGHLFYDREFIEQV